MKTYIKYFLILIAALTYSQSSNNWRLYYPRNLDPNFPQQFYSIAVDKNDNVWAAGEEMYMFDGATWKNFPQNPVTSHGSTEIFTLVVDDSNNIYQGAERGFVKHDGNVFSVQYPDSKPMWLALGPNNVLWASENNNNPYNYLLKLENNILTTYDTTDVGLAILRTRSIAVDKNGVVWGYGKFRDVNNNIFTRLFSFNGTHWEIYPDYYTPSYGIHSVYVDYDNNVWVGTANNQAAKFDQITKSWEVFSTLPVGSFALNTISCFVVDRNAVLWIGFWDGGLARKFGNNWTLYNSANSPLDGDDIWDIKVDSKNNLWIAVNQSGSGNGGVVEFNENGIVDGTTSVEENSNKIPESYSLLQNYPNPFNPSTTIVYNIPESGLVILKIYDVLGREIRTLLNEEKPAGSYKINFDSGGLPSGIYFYRITAGNYTAVKKMILLK